MARPLRKAAAPPPTAAVLLILVAHCCCKCDLKYLCKCFRVKGYLIWLQERVKVHHHAFSLDIRFGKESKTRRQKKQLLSFVFLTYFNDAPAAETALRFWELKHSFSYWLKEAWRGHFWLFLIIFICALKMWLHTETPLCRNLLF